LLAMWILYLRYMQQSRRLRILEVSEPNKDGVFIHVRGLLHHLQREGHDLTYAYSDLRSSTQLAPLLCEIETQGAKTKNLLISNTPSTGDFKALLWLLWCIINDRPDIVHGHSSKAGALIRMAAFLLPSCAYIYTPHAYYSMAKQPVGLKIGYWWIEQLLAHLAVTINISQDERKFAKQKLCLGRAKAMIAPNPVDLDWFRPASMDRKKTARSKWGISANAFVFGTLARFGEQKDLGTFYEAAINCALNLPNVHFVHLGSGLEAAHYQAQVSKAGVNAQFTFIDFLADTAPFYACLDCFIITSRFEAGWPIVMLEALATDLPLITTNFIGLQANDPSHLSHTRIISVGDISQLILKITEFVSEHNHKEIKTNHSAYVEAHFSPNVCYGKVTSLYRDLAQPATII
jgi:glycosyltransferase involved in cell wall biosynthesis